MFRVRPLKGDIIEASACPRLLGIMKRIQGTYIITSRAPCPPQPPPQKSYNLHHNKIRTQKAFSIALSATN